MRVAIVHYWLTGMRGGERVVESLCELYPDADIFTHVYNPDAVSRVIRERNVRTTFVQRLPNARKWYRSYLPVMPLALEQLDLKDYDVVISSESGPAKGVLVRSQALHVCYCHTPMRYLWDLYHEYRGERGLLGRLAIPPLAHYLRMWDLAAASRVDRFVANSHYVARRIEKTYRRNAEVIYPPVSVDRFRPDRPRENFYLFVSQLVSYKRADIVLDAFRGANAELVVIGTGPEQKRLAALAGPNVKFLGWQTDEAVADYMERCRALIFPAEEDFGIVPVEAQAAGAPVIAFGRGGARETVLDGKTGLFFMEQSSQSVRACLQRFERQRFDPKSCRAQAESFREQRFLAGFRAFVEAQLEEHGRASRGPMLHVTRGDA